jgi:hypothetical protein
MGGAGLVMSRGGMAGTNETRGATSSAGWFPLFSDSTLAIVAAISPGPTTAHCREGFNEVNV